MVDESDKMDRESADETSQETGPVPAAAWGGHPLLDRLRPLFATLGQEVYLVGGAVRDFLLSRQVKDLDFVTPDGAIRLAFALGDLLGQPAYALDRERDAGRIMIPESDTTIDIAQIRGPDLESDLRHRDFTINAMALAAGEQSLDSVIDPLDGRADLSKRLVRQTHPMAIANDPVRSLRAIRLTLELDFSLLPETEFAIRGAAPVLERVSIERVRDELLKMLRGPAPGRAVVNLSDLALLPAVLPEIAALDGVRQSKPHQAPVLDHTIATLDFLVGLEGLVDKPGIPTGDRPLAQAQACLAPYAGQLKTHLDRPVVGGLDGRHLLHLGALFHDAGKAGTQEIEADGRIRFLDHDWAGAELASQALNRLRLGREAVKHVRSIVAGHMRPLLLVRSEKFGRRAIYRFFRDTGTAGLDICLLSLADHLATYADGQGEEAWQQLLAVNERLLNHFFYHHETTVQPRPLLNGWDLIEALDLQPGPEVGRLLQLIEEAQAAGELTSRAEALALAGRSLNENG